MNSKKKYTTILFDLDGTLIDSKPGIVTAIKKALKEYNIPYTDELLDQMVGPPFRISMKQLLGINDMSLIEKLILVYRSNYKAGDWRDCSVYEGVVDMLATLKSAGFTLGLATSKPLQYTTIIMDELDLTRHFNFVGGATGDATTELKTDVINMVLDRLGVTDRDSVLMVGDRLYDVEGAKQSGVDSAGITWGYGDRAEHVKCGADFIFDTPDQLVKFLTETI